MDPRLEILMLIQVGAGLLMAADAVSPRLRMVKPTQLHGFRVPKTLTDPDVWFAANAHDGRFVFGFGVVYAIVADGLALRPGIGADAYAWTCPGTLAFGLTAVLVLCFRYPGRIGR